MNSSSIPRFTVVLLLTLVIAASASAWDVTYLHPASCNTSSARCVSSGFQGGHVQVGSYNYMHAALWSGDAGSFTDMHPSGAFSSVIHGVSGNHQAGTVGIGYDGVDFRHGNRAALWSGAAGEWTNLHPTVGSYEFSELHGISGNQQVGTVNDDVHYFASLWNGTAASWTSLHPAGKTESNAWATDGVQQVGDADGRACLWEGTSGSYVDLDPSGSTGSSATAVWGGKQVGYTDRPDSYSSRAALWYGTAESRVDLNPDGWDASMAQGIFGEWQVGLAYMSTSPFISHAVLWKGTRESCLDLHGFLAGGYDWSYAYGIDVIGNDMYIAGLLHPVDGGWEAVLWHHVVPEPSSLLVLGCGLIALAGLVCRRR
jgi:hypothetical protein